MAERFEDQVVLITGAASGIGAATARRFASEGARVVVADIDEAGASRVARDLDNRGWIATSAKIDVREPQQFEAIIAHIVSVFGRIDVLFNNAGIAAYGESPELDPQIWHNVLAVDLHSVFYGTRAAVPYMRHRGRGSIVNSASISGLYADFGLAAYNAAKAGVVNYTRTAALDHAKDGIRVNAVCPGPIDSALADFQQRYPQVVQEWTRNIPMGRIGRADEVAGAVTFLCSADASYITGTTLVIDGGLTASTGQINYTRVLRGT
jgi:meso-butanediol dehydrogenase/(S,S)-butanediol dehydrogenase/diacetyl reductase